MFFKVFCRCRYTKRNKETFFRDKNFTEIRLKTPDGILLHGAIRKGTTKKALLYMGGLGNRFEEMADSKSYGYGVLDLANRKLRDWTFMSANYRGRGDSHGHYIPQFFHYDAYSAMEYLIEHEGFDPDDILAIGHSMGGNAVIRASVLLQMKYPQAKISAIIDRSFLFLRHVLDARFGTGCRGKCVVRATNKFGWHVDSTEASKLKGKIIAIISKRDLAVPYSTAFGKVNTLDNMHVLEIDFEEVKDTHAEAFTHQHQDELYALISELFLKDAGKVEKTLSPESVLLSLSDEKSP